MFNRKKIVSIFNRVEKINYQLLRSLALFTGLLHIILVVFNIRYPPNSVYQQFRVTPVWYIIFAASLIMIITGLLLAWGLKKRSYHIFFAFFLCLVGSNITLYFAWAFVSDLWYYIIAAGSFWLSASFFIYSTIRFSGKFSAEAYHNFFKGKRRPHWYKAFVIYFSDGRHFWFMLSPAILLLYCLSYLGSLYIAPALGVVVHLLVFAIGLVYFRITYHLSGHESRNKLAWLLWGLIATISVFCVRLILELFLTKYLTDVLAILLLTLYHLIVCFSIVMTVFFAKATNARLVVKKTILYSILLLSGLLVFGILEHYLIHVMSHVLHVESSILSSVLGGSIALLLRPLHHRVEHWLNHFAPAMY